MQGQELMDSLEELMGHSICPSGEQLYKPLPFVLHIIADPNMILDFNDYIDNMGKIFRTARSRQRLYLKRTSEVDILLVQLHRR